MAKKILVIEDDPVIVNYIENVLQDNGYETCSAVDGVAAYEVLQTEKPDLITLDLELPEEWGTRFFRRLTRDSEFNGVPVIVISGMASRHLALKRVVAALSKPFDPDKLVALIRKTIG